MVVGLGQRHNDDVAPFLPDVGLRPFMRSRRMAGPDIAPLELGHQGPGMSDALWARKAKRASDNIRTEMSLRFATLPESHPLSTKVRAMFDDALGADAKDFRLIVQPDNYEINSMVLPDSTIVNPAGFLRFARYTESAKAVQAHEATHAKRDHSRNLYNLTKDIGDGVSIYDRFMQQMSLYRKQEAEADLGWMVGQLKDCNVNPWGMVSFNERLSEVVDETKAWAGRLSHGELEDRALDAQSVFHFVNMRRLKRELKEYPPDLKADLEGLPARKPKLLDSRIGQKGEELQETDAIRLRLATDLPASDISVAFGDLLALFGSESGRRAKITSELPKKRVEMEDLLEKAEKNRKTAAKYRRIGGLENGERAEQLEKNARRKVRQAREIEGELVELKDKQKDSLLRTKTDREILELLANRVEQEVLPYSDWADPARKAAARVVYYELYAGLKYLETDKRYKLDLESGPKSFNERLRTDREIMQTQACLEALPDVLSDPKMLSLDGRFIERSPANLIERALKSYAKCIRLGEDATEEKVARFVDYSARLCRSVEALYEERGVNQFPAQETFSAAPVIAASTLPGSAPALKDCLLLQAQGSGLVAADSKKEHELGSDLTWRKIEHEAKQIGADIEAIAAKGKAFDFSEYSGVMARLGDVAARHSLDHRGIRDVFHMMLGGAIKESKSDTYLPRDEVEQDTYIHDLSQGALSQRVKEHALQRLFNEVVDLMPQFNGLSAIQRECLKLHGIINFVSSGRMVLGTDDFGKFMLRIPNLGGDRHDQFFWYEKYENATEVSPSNKPLLAAGDFDEWSRRRSSVEETFLAPDWSARELADMHSVLLDQFTNKVAQRHSISYDNMLKDYQKAERGIFNRALDKHLAKAEGWDEFFHSLSELEGMGVPVTELIQKSRHCFGLSLCRLWTKLPRNPKPAQADQVLKAVSFAQNPNLRLRLQEYYYEKVWPSLDFDERLDAMFSKQNSGFFDLNRFRRFSEYEAKTHDEIEKTRKRFNEEFDAFMKKGSREEAIAILVSALRASPKASQDFIMACMDTTEGDARLKNVLYRCVSSLGKNKLLGLHGNEGDDDEGVSSNVMERITVSETLLRIIYSLDDTGKHLLLRRLLTGKNGLVSNPELRSSFLTAMVDRTMHRNEDKTLQGPIDHTIAALGGTESWKPLYFALSPLLAERMRPPAKRTNWDMVEEVRRDVEANVLHFEPAIADIAERTVSLASDKPRPLSQSHTSTPWRHLDELAAQSDARLEQRLKKLGFGQKQGKPKLLGPLSFIVSVGEKTGPIGPRLIQLIPQFADLPDERSEETFSRVFDKLKGADKLPALPDVELEWPSMWDEVDTLGEPIGGGSLMTVYDMRLKDGRRQVLKVSNPNVEHFLEVNGELASETLQLMAKAYPDKYSNGKYLLQDVTEWIKREINASDFLENDREFRDDKKNHGYRLGVKGKDRYSIYVPKSEGPKSNYFIREEFIDGKGLTEWKDLVAAGHDMKQVVSLLVNNYVKQLRDGLVISDAHIGNFKVTEQNQVAILDRKLFLRLDRGMQGFVDTLLSPAAFTLGKKGLADLLIGMSKEPVPEANRGGIETALEGFIPNLLTGKFDDINKTLASLRRNGLRLPLEFTLTMKNLSSFNQMAKKAGFGGIMEAYSFGTTEEDA